MAYYTSKRKISIYTRFIIYGVIAVVLSFVQMLSFDLIAIDGITPDLLIVLVAWIAIYEGRLHGLFAGFAIGLIFDLISLDVIGTNALAKTIVAFSAGWFYEAGKEDVLPGSYKFPLLVLLSAFLHNLVYYFFYIKASDLNFLNFFLRYGLAASFYTSVFSLFVMFFKLRKRY